MTRTRTRTATALSVLAVAALVGLPVSPALADVQPQPQTVTFSSPGTFTYTVLPAITSVSIHAAGAAGGNGQAGTYAYGGAAGETISTLAVVPGQQLQINVGGAGGQPGYDPNGCNSSGGGFNGGGAASYESGTGGGASDVRSAPYGLDDRLVVAGGGGGAGVDFGTGGQGGNPATDGQTAFPNWGNSGGGAGTQSAGGAGGAGSDGNGSAGSAGTGGNGGCNSQYSASSGGGGGGWFGGGGGGAGYGYGSGGGGGSSYGPAGSTFTTGTHSGNGSVTITFTAPAVGPATRITVTPATATTSAGEAQIYAAEAFDVYGDDLGDVTSSTTFIVDGGSCAGASCAVTPAGDHTVTATYQGLDATATQTVRAATSLVLSGFPTTTAAGLAHTVTVHALDSVGAPALNDNDALTVTSTDGNAVLPSTDPVMADGQVQFPVTLNNAGSQTITVTDNALGISATVPAVDVSGAVSFTVTGYPANSAAGESHTVTVTALDSNGVVVTDYAGTVHLSSSDSGAALAPDATLTNGVGTFATSLHTAGTQSISATGVNDGALTGTDAGLAVGPGPLAQLLPTVSGGFTAGVGKVVTVHGGDAYGNVTPWTGTAHFGASDDNATLPEDATAANDVASATMVLTTQGSQTIEVSDTTNPTVTGAVGVNVAPAHASSVSVRALAPAVAGTTTYLGFMVKDAYGNVIPSTFISSVNPYRTLPGRSEVSLGVMIAGIYSYDPTFVFHDSPGYNWPSSATMNTAGSTRVYFQGRLCYSWADCAGGYWGGSRSGYFTGTTSTIDVAPAPASRLDVSFASTTNAGDAQPVTVTARDPYGNVVPLNQPLDISSSDPTAELPTGAALVDGTWSGSVTLKRSGGQSVTVTDTDNPGLSAGVGTTVAAGPVASFGVTGYPAGAQAGDAIHDVQVVGEDAYGNVATDFSGTLTVTSSDPQAALPSPVTATGGQATLPVELRTSGTQTITVTDPDSGLTGTESVVVAAAGASRLVVSAATSPALVGSPDTITVRALDTYGNLLDGDTDTLTITSSDPAGSVPSSVALVGGVATFTATLGTVGSATLQVTDATASVTGVTIVPVVPGAAVTLRLSDLPAQAVAGQALPVTVTALDAQGNVATGSTASVQLSSSDDHAHLPSTVTLADGVAHVALSLDTAGSTTVTASGGQLASASHTTTVTAGPTRALVVTTPASPKHDAVVPLTVQALDGFGNAADTDTATVRFSSTDDSATLPAATPLAGGVLSTSLTWHTSGRQTLTVTESDISGTAADITVSGTVPSAAGAGLPAPPTIQGVTTGKGRVTVHFVGHADGGAPVTSYTVTSSPDRSHPHGFTATGARSPITVTGLHPGDYYTFTVTAISSAGTGPVSAPSKAVNPSPGPSPIALHYAFLGGAKSVLGLPVGPERTHAGGSERAYQHGTMYYSYATGARMVLGPIATRYRHLGATLGRLGYPLRDDHRVATGRQVDFQHGSIVYVAKTHALTVTFH